VITSVEAEPRHHPAAAAVIDAGMTKGVSCCHTQTNRPTTLAQAEPVWTQNI
jgi:hypothetical protein